MIPAIFRPSAERATPNQRSCMSGDHAQYHVPGLGDMNTCVSHVAADLVASADKATQFHPLSTEAAVLPVTRASDQLHPAGAAYAAVYRRPSQATAAIRPPSGEIATLLYGRSTSPAGRVSVQVAPASADV